MEKRFFTRTMAEVYAGQGYFKEALRIFRGLLENDPASESLRNRITALEAAQAAVAEDPRLKLPALFAVWLDLMQVHNQKKKWENLKTGFKEGGCVGRS